MMFDATDFEDEDEDYFDKEFEVISKSKNLIDMIITKHFLKTSVSGKCFFAYDKFYKYLSSLRTDNDLHTFHECMLRFEKLAYEMHKISIFKFEQITLLQYMNSSRYWTPKHEELFLVYYYGFKVFTYQEFIDFNVEK
jgi:hypothetical protein